MRGLAPVARVTTAARRAPSGRRASSPRRGRPGDPVGVLDDVGVEHDQVGRVAGQEQAAAAVLADRGGRAGGESQHGVRDREPLGRIPGLAAVAGAVHGGGDAGERVERGDRGVGAEGQVRAGVEQVAEPVGRRRPRPPDAVGEVAVVERVQRLHRGGHAERGKAGQVGVVDALGVLDPGRHRDALPGVAARLQAVERGPHRRVADRVHRHREPARRRLARDPGHVVRREQRGAGAVEHPGRARPQRAVHEGLHRPDAHQLAPESRAQLERRRRPEHLGRHAHVHAQVQPAVGVEPLPQAAPARALEVVHADDAAGVRLGDAGADGAGDLERLRRRDRERERLSARAGRPPRLGPARPRPVRPS